MGFQPVPTTPPPIPHRGTLTLLLCLAACQPAHEPMFQLLDASHTGVTFANTIATGDSANVQDDVYVYNGAGVAVGDIDNDGLPDLFFSGNMVPSRLYRNLGDMRFEDITRSAGMAINRWATGATMVDINADGHLDIYVSITGPAWSTPAARANQLFINNGNRTFTESAAEYGIADNSFTIHSVFLDYDRDGCLDLFLLNNSPADFSRGEDARHPSGRRGDTPGSHNRLYRGICTVTDAGAGLAAERGVIRVRFEDVSERAGILRDAGYGLGVAVADLNADGWPDLYISNDASPNDVLYVNNGDGTFSDKAAAWLKHASFAGMGVDIADVNNDGWPDILQVDMMPHDLATRKRMSGFMTHSAVLEARGRGFRTDYSVNTLQLHGGLTPRGDVLFSDIAMLAGVAATDWSWSPLFADFDNDGHKDIVITNGYPKAVNDFDYQTRMFSLRRARDTVESRRAGRETLDRLHAYDVSNVVYRNRGDLTFADMTRAWGMERPSLSYGAAYADLDNDGRLDLVVSNIDAPAFIYRNVAPRSDSTGRYVQVRLEGAGPNRAGLGATLTLHAGTSRQHLYVSPYRGYMSTVDQRAHFGLGGATRVDSLAITWPDGRRQVLTDVAADRVVVVRQVDALAPPVPAVAPVPLIRSADRPFVPFSAPGLAFRHPAGGRVDYAVQPLLPYMLSHQGPVMAVADVNGDGLDDLFISGHGAGGVGKPGMRQLLLQRRDGSFAVSPRRQPWDQENASEDWGALFFDANGDSLPDLYLASGGYHVAPGSPLLQDRLYINQGGGRFVRDIAALPPMLTSTAAVRAGDFTGDGRPDLFIGGRLTPLKYPFPTGSYLLRNDGGRFSDVTAQFAPSLADTGGMVTDAAFVDIDGDQRLDLVTVGEWMPIQFFLNQGTQFSPPSTGSLPPARGWWYSLAVGDFDGDGRPDLVAGNLGLNGPYKTSQHARLGVYAGDLSGSGGSKTDIVLTQELDGVEHPVAGLVPLGREIYSLGLRYPSYRAFATAPVADAFGEAALRAALHYQVDTFASILLRNEGGGAFSMRALPNLAQVSPLRGTLPYDVDSDGKLDLLAVGNLYDMEPNSTRADAGNGLWLKGDGSGGFVPMPPGGSGFIAPLNAAALALLRTPSGAAVLVANTADSLQAYLVRPSAGGPPAGGLVTGARRR